VEAVGARNRIGLGAALLMMGWLSFVLALDGAGPPRQALLGACTWVVLGVALSRCTSLVRAQALVVVAFATVVEYLFSAGLGVYVYRLDNVPAYVPPGHGLVYLSAYALGHAVSFRTVRLAVLLVLGGWAAYGLLLADRQDLLGALWFGCLLAFVRWGPSTGVYVGAGLVVTWLELLGTRLGTWTWQPEDPTGLVSIGNPPSGVAGGYGWFDLVALLAAPALLRGWSSLRGRPVEVSDPAKGRADVRDPAEEGVAGARQGVVGS
jgi:hypothetical protein